MELNIEKDEVYTFENAITIINAECNAIFSDDNKINKPYVSIRNLLDWSLKIVVNRENPITNVNKCNFDFLIDIIQRISAFPHDFVSFLYKYKKLGNKEAHGKKIATSKLNTAREELKDYLQWFFDVYLKESPPSILATWHEAYALKKNNPKGESLNIKEEVHKETETYKNEIESLEAKHKKILTLYNEAHLSESGQATISTLEELLKEHERLDKLKKELDKLKKELEFKLEKERKNKLLEEWKKSGKWPFTKPDKKEIIRRIESSLTDLKNNHLFIAKLIDNTIANWIKEVDADFKGMEIKNFGLLGIHPPSELYAKTRDSNEYTYDQLRKKAIKYIVIHCLERLLKEAMTEKEGAEFKILNNYKKLHALNDWYTYKQWRGVRGKFETKRFLIWKWIPRKEKKRVINLYKNEMAEILADLNRYKKIVESYGIKDLRQILPYDINKTPHVRI